MPEAHRKQKEPNQLGNLYIERGYESRSATNTKEIGMETTGPYPNG
jgi:hypothetical protein